MGWHTQNHYPLSSLPIEAQKPEIDNMSSEQFKNVVFSYPYGESVSVNQDSIRIVKESGYPCAVSNVSEPNNIQGEYFLSRYMLPHNKYLLHFELSGTKHFIHTHKLLTIIK